MRYKSLETHCGSSKENFAGCLVERRVTTTAVAGWSTPNESETKLESVIFKVNTVNWVTSLSPAGPRHSAVRPTRVLKYTNVRCCIKSMPAALGFTKFKEPEEQSETHK